MRAARCMNRTASIAVSSGIGPFTPSFPADFPQWFRVLAITPTNPLLMFFNDQIVWNEANPVAGGCLGSDCVSKIWVAGVTEIWPSPYSGQFAEANAFTVNREQGLQVDYWTVRESEGMFTTDNCRRWGDQTGCGIQICIKNSSYCPNSLVAGLSRT